jgi:hypothetical protein
MKTDDANYSRKELDELFQIDKLSTPKYSWREGFMIISNAGQEEAWGVNIFFKDLVLPGVKIMKGDILMTLAGGKDGQIIYHRLLRRLPISN